jgi:hypothetical protein
LVVLEDDEEDDDELDEELALYSVVIIKVLVHYPSSFYE